MTSKEIKRYDRAVKILLQTYVDALDKKHIRKPLAYALYQTWKQIDKSEVERDERI